MQTLKPPPRKISPLQPLTFILSSPMDPLQPDPHPLIQAIVVIAFAAAFAAVLFGYCH